MASQLDRIEARLDRLEGILRGFVQATEEEWRTNPPEKLGAKMRKEVFRRLAARARAAKAVGPGKGGVKSPRTKRRLERESDR